MVELFEKLMLSGLGALALSRNKAEELIGDLRETYLMSEEEGRALLDRLQTVAREARGNLEEIARNEVTTALHAAGVVTRDEYERLAQRVAALERRVATMAEADDPEE